MDQGNQYNQYGYDSYDQPRTAKRTFMRKNFGESFGNPMRNRILTGAALLLTGAAFASIIIASYPDGDQENVPVIKADQTAFREAPDNPGGREIPYQDSTIYSSLRSETMPEPPPIENLLEQEQPIDKMEMFAQEMESQMNTQGALEEKASGASVLSAADMPPQPEPATNNAAAPSEPAAKATESVKAGSDPNVKIITMESETIAPSAEPIDRSKPSQLHAAGSSPETIEYVRSVLEKKSSGATPATAASPAASATPAAPPSVTSIEPASGMATMAPGNYYVQLGSVTSETGAASEWSKLQKTFSVLGSASYRVERADLGDRGTFYRIQAGPMSKDSAASICDSIKAQKPGGCLVVQ